MNTLKRVLIFVAQLAVALGIVLYFGDMLHDEVLRPTRDKAVMGGAFAMVLVGMLSSPFAGPLILAGFRRGIAAGQLGRRAYDNKGLVIETAETETPEKKP